MVEADATSLKRIRWQCRRGTKELDLVFERFLEEGGYATLDRADQQVFQRLLALEDYLLQAWLIAGTPPPDRELSRLVERIREPHFPASR